MDKDFLEETFGYRDLMTVTYLPGEDDEIQYRNQRQRRTSLGGGPNEALTRQARLQRARIMKRNRAKILRGIRLAKMRMASPEKLKGRARKAARKFLFNKIARGIPKDELTFERRAEIEKRLDTPTMKKRIERLSIKLLKDIRKKEMERRSKND